MNNYDTDICHLMSALSNYNHHFAIQETFITKNQDLKKFEILNDEHLLILQIVYIIFMRFKLTKYMSRAPLIS